MLLKLSFGIFRADLTWNHYYRTGVALQIPKHRTGLSISELPEIEERDTNDKSYQNLNTQSGNTEKPKKRLVIQPDM